MSQPDFALRNNIRFKGGTPLVERWLLQQIFKAIGPAPLRFAFQDGEEMVPAGVAPVATVVIRDRRTLARMIVDPEIAFGEAFAGGRIEVEGDLARALEAVYESWPSGRANTSWYQRVTSSLMGWRQANSLHGSRQNVHCHYDLGNDFYKLWLDPQLVYTCAYYPSPSATLAEAQEAKLDYVCRKLQLQPGDRVIEAGCGWAHSRSTWRGITAYPSGRSTSRTSRFSTPASELPRKDSAIKLSSSRTIGAISPERPIYSFPWECWNTWPLPITPAWEKSFIVPWVIPAAGSSTSLAEAIKVFSAAGFGNGFSRARTLRRSVRP